MSAYGTVQGRWTARDICLTAVMTAVVFFMTFVPKIPIPLGYAHLGDAAIFLLVVLAGRREAVWAGCLGSALADFLGGFALWIGPTLLIKYLMAMTFVLLMDKGNAWLKSPRTFIALLAACLVMAAGYTLFGAILYDSLAAGLSSAPGLLLEGGVNIAAFYLAAVVLPICKGGKGHTPLPARIVSLLCAYSK